MMGKRIKSLRKQHEITQTELGKMIGVNQTTINSYEKDISLPPIDRLSKMADIFEVSVDYLLGKTDERSLAKKHDGPSVIMDLENELSNLILQLNEDKIVLAGKKMDDTTRRIMIKSLKNSIDLAKNLTN